VAERFRREILSRGGERDGMDMYRSFRGAEPDKTAMLVARGLIEEPTAEEETAALRQITKVDTRAQARARAERSRQERAAARKADSLAMTDSLAQTTVDAE
jgi:hypothetical protein